MMKESINVQELYNFSVQKKMVNAKVLTELAQKVYDLVKIWGIDNIAFFYTDKKEDVVIPASESAEVMRAVVIRIMQQQLRMTDSNSGRLEKHFGLKLLAREYLNLKNADETECMSVYDFMQQFLDSNPHQ